jgi:hypothetical protein
MSDTTTETKTKHTMKSMGRDEKLYHLFYSHTGVSHMSRRMYVKYLTEDGEIVEISEATKVDDTNVESEGLAALLEDFKSRFPHGEYRGRGIWSSSKEKVSSDKYFGFN